MQKKRESTRDFSEKTGDQCEMDRDFSPLLIVGNRVGLHTYEVSKALDTETRLVQFSKKIVIGHGAI